MSLFTQKRTVFARLVVAAWLGLFLAGCSAAGKTPAATATPTRAAVVSQTDSPAAPDTPSATAATAETTAPETVLPAGTPTATQTALPSGWEDTLAPTLAKTADPNWGRPFSDCERTPGLVGCDPDSPPILARVAVSDPDGDRLVVLDLANDDSWQAGGQPLKLSWSPAGLSLLAWQAVEGGRELMEWNAWGQRMQAETASQDLRWQSNGLLSQDNAFENTTGERYRLELVGGKGWQLAGRIPGEEPRQVTIDAQPADRQYRLIDQLADGDLLLQSYYPTNLGLTAGGELLRVDPRSGKVSPLGVSAPLADAESFAVSPAWPDGPLAFSAAGGEPGMTRLALYNLAAQSVDYPFPAGAQSAFQDWHPQEKLLLAALVPLGNAPGGDFPAAGIYQYDPQSRKATLLVRTPPGAQDGGARWAKDGRALVYIRLTTGSGGKAQAEVRGLYLDTQREVVLFRAIAAFAGRGGVVDWAAIATVGR